jgi:hypothetical protein
MRKNSNRRVIGTLAVITLCLTCVVISAMTQSYNPLFGDASNATDGETDNISEHTSTSSSSPENTPVLSPSPTPSLTPTIEQNTILSLAPNQTQTPAQTPSLTPSEPTPVLSPTSIPSLTPTPQEQNSSSSPASNQTQTPPPSATPGQNNTSISTPTPSPTPSHAAPAITTYAPSSPVQDTDGDTRTFNISIDLAVNVNWLLNGTEVFNQSNVTDSIYTNTRAKIGTWNVSAVATNANGTDMQTWIWNVSSQVAPTPTPTPGPTPSPSPLTTPTPAPLKILSSNVKSSTPFYIDGWVNYENGAECLNPTVNIINTNTSESGQAETSPKSNCQTEHSSTPQTIQ